MNTFSGITWNMENDMYEIYWGASGSGDISYVIKAEWNGSELEIKKTYLFNAENGAKNRLAN